MPRKIAAVNAEPKASPAPVRDTDFTGVVFHGAYVNFFERGRTDALRLIGIGHAALKAADYVPARPAGRGAVREVCEQILAHRGQ